MPGRAEGALYEIQQHNNQSAQPRQPQRCNQVLPKLQLLAVAKSRSEFSTTATIIHGATDRQNVACAELVFTNETCIHAVNQAGFPEVALTLLVLGRGYLAADLQGLLAATMCLVSRAHIVVHKGECPTLCSLLCKCCQLARSIDCLHLLEHGAECCLCFGGADISNVPMYYQ